MRSSHSLNILYALFSIYFYPFDFSAQSFQFFIHNHSIPIESTLNNRFVYKFHLEPGVSD